MKTEKTIVFDIEDIKMYRKPAMEIQKSNQLRILLMGKTGSGKSSLGNQLKGDKVFKVSRNNGTKESQLARRTLEDGTELVIVDTPGYCNIHLSDEEVQSQVDRGMELLAPGPHFIINVFSSTERVTGDDITILQTFQRRFDLYLQKHVMVVFTGVDELEEEGQILEEYIQMLPTQLKYFLSKLGWSPIGVAAKHHSDIHNFSKIIDALQQLYNKPGQPFIDISTVRKRKGDISVEESKVAKKDGIALNDKRTVVLLGKCGIGKSSIGNVLLGEKKFSASMWEDKGTKTCQIKESDQLVVVDTPGFFTSLRPDVDTATDIITTLKQKSIHVLILVLSVDERFSGSEEKALDFVRSLFGSELPEQLMYVFTGKDSLEDDEREFIFPHNLPRRPYYIVNCKGYTQKDRDDLLTEILGRRFQQPIPLTRMDKAQLDNITRAEKQRIASTKVDGEAYRTAVYSALGNDEPVKPATTSKPCELSCWERLCQRILSWF